jgi:lysozyme
MIASDRGIELIKRFEGFESKPYKCPGDVWTIGYGTTKGIGPNTPPITKEEAEDLLLMDMATYEDGVSAAVKVPLTQNQFDALVSFTYNLGVGAFRRSTLLKKLNKGDYDAVPAELIRWNKANGKVMRGLTRRRTAEANLWQEHQDIEPTSGVEPKRDVPTIVNTENISAVAAAGSGVVAGNLEPNNPIAWALAAIMVVGAAVFLYLFLRRRGA